ncbi:MAG TPA: hypothetical protein VMR52_10130 [Dehalococcoidia bacterium]|nr:hypothetical protein [Dehalococcoidia bacterium]
MYARIIALFVIVAAIALVLAVIGLAVSGGDDDDGSNRDDNSVDGELASCSALSELESYRYAISVHIAGVGESPSEPQEGELTTAPLSALGEALAQLLSDFSLEGAYVNPDRSLALLTFGEEEIELRQFGDESWVRVGDEWEQGDASADELLMPVLVCNEVVQAVSPSLVEAEPTDVTANGIDATHYVLDPEKTQNLPPVLGQELTDPYTVDLWVAEDGRYPARLHIESDDPDGEEPAFRLAMEVMDVGDEEIRVETPETD